MTLIKGGNAISGTRLLGATKPKADEPSKRDAVVIDEGVLRTLYAHELEELRREERKRTELEAESAIQAELERLSSAHDKEIQRMREQHAEATRHEIETLRALFKEAEKQIREEISKLRELAVSVSFQSVTKILGRKSASNELVALMVEEVLATQRINERPIVYVSPGDHEKLAACKEMESVELVADDRLKRGSCKLEAGAAVFDAGIDAQLEGLKQAFLSALREGHESA